MNRPSTLMFAGAAGLVAASTLAAAEGGADPGGPVVVVVRVPKPWYAPKAAVVGKMRDTIAQYERVPGLLFKAYSLERETADYGGLYLWRDRARAQAWFDPAWFERVRKERGTDASVRFFDAPVSIDNIPGGTPAQRDAGAVGTLVEIPIPSGVTRERLVAEFTAAVPVYQKVPGLMRKQFTISDKGSFGGIYLWKDEAAARAWFNDAWHARVIKTYGQDAKIEWFDTPILLPSADSANQAAAALQVIAP